MVYKLGYINHDDYLKYDFGRSHPMNKLRISMVKDLLESLDFFKSESVHQYESELSSDEDLLTVHTQEYINKIKELSRTGIGYVDRKDTPAFKGMYEITKRAVGGTLKAVDLIMENKVNHAWNSLGGFHHAKASSGSGFCIFNDAAIAIKKIINNYGLERVLYLDIDAHHGDGVQEIFYNNDKVFKISIHESGKTLFPYSGFIGETGEKQGQGYNINIPLPIGTFDEAYTHILNKILPLVSEYFSPQFIVFVIGPDAHYLDPLSHLSLTSNSYLEIANLVHDMSHKFCGGKCLLLGGGGYSLNATPRIWALILSEFVNIKLNNNIPKDWIEKYSQIFNHENIYEKLPEYLEDTQQPKIDPLRFKKISSQITQITDRIIENIYLMYGFFKMIK
jgi:acetoin utilization protein AcuC